MKDYIELVDDPDFAEFIKQNSGLIPPDLVGTDLMQKEDYSNYPPEDFALRVGEARYFPLTNPAETVASMLAYLYAVKTNSIEDDHILRKIAFWIKQAYKKYKLQLPQELAVIPAPDDPSDMLSNVVDKEKLENEGEEEEEETPKLGLTDLHERIQKNAYAIKVDGQPYLPLGTIPDITKSASIYEKQYKRLDPADRMMVAEKIKAAAIAKQIDLSKYAVLHRYATRQVNAFTEQGINSRLTASHDLSERNSLRLIKTAAANARTEEELRLLADQLYELDKTASWKHYIDSFIPDAYKTFGYIKSAGSDLPGESVVTSYNVLDILHNYGDEVRQKLEQHFKDVDQMMELIERNPRGAWGRYPQIRDIFRALYEEHKTAIQ